MCGGVLYNAYWEAHQQHRTEAPAVHMQCDDDGDGDGDGDGVCVHVQCDDEGLSCFIVPRWIPNADPPQRNSGLIFNRLKVRRPT